MLKLVCALLLVTTAFSLSEYTKEYPGLYADKSALKTNAKKMQRIQLKLPFVMHSVPDEKHLSKTKNPNLLLVVQSLVIHGCLSINQVHVVMGMAPILRLLVNLLVLRWDMQVRIGTTKRHFVTVTHGQ
eukprot:UN34543